MATFDKLSPEQVLAKDRRALELALQRERLSEKQQRRFEKSAQRVASRQLMVPRVEFDQDLPIANHLTHVQDLLVDHQVVVVAGETGSGKTTQLPLACLTSGYGVRGMIGHTQPRRLAARSVAHRIASQCGVTLGEQVGFAVRFSEQWSSNTLIKVMTDGLLLAEIRSDKNLTNYDLIIVDEAHERSLNIDFLLGYLHKLLRIRTELRVIITSATIDVDLISKHFHNAPVVQVEGRGFPVDIVYKPPTDGVETAVYECLDEIVSSSTESARDVLMFLASEREILEWSSQIRRRYVREYEVLPLYARLPVSEQRRIFEKSKRRRLLLSTNVAETSLTVPNIGYVIDLGQARISRYNLRSRIQRLPIERISQASANQRAGRCGRIAPGVCYRICDSDEFETSALFTDPEIQRTNLASVLLQALYFRFGDIRDFPFIDKPDSRAVNEANRTLEELGALKDARLTTTGVYMARLPIEPRMARMLVEAGRRNALSEVLIVVSGLTAQDPRYRPLDRQQAADKAHEKFNDVDSDFLALIKLWKWAETKRQELSVRDFRRVLESNYVSANRFMEWRSLHRQLLVVCRQLGFKVNKQDASFRAIHTSIVCGSLAMLGFKRDKSQYQGPKNLNFKIFPGSSIFNKQPKWVVASEIIETSQVFARCVATIQPRWIEDVAGSHFSFKYHDPFWDAKRQEGMILGSATFQGLPVVNRRPVRLALHDVGLAQKLFIEYTFIKAEKANGWGFLVHNLALLREIRERQQRQRRLDLLISESDQIVFYRAKLPTEVVSRRSFEKWYESCDQTERDGLFMSQADVLLREDHASSASAFPSRLQVGDLDLVLDYRFAPGELDDGVSVRISYKELDQLEADPLDWHVPGYFEVKIQELIRTLPKQKRKALVPIPQHVTQVIPELLDHEFFRRGNLQRVLAETLRKHFGVQVDAEDWQVENVSDFLRMNIKLVDQQDKLIDQDRDIQKLRSRTTQHLTELFDNTQDSSQQPLQIRSFPEGGLELKKLHRTTAGEFHVYPTLIDKIDHVYLEMRPEASSQYSLNKRGLARLVSYAESGSVRYLEKEFKKEQQMLLQFAKVASPSRFFDSFVIALIQSIYFPESDLPETLEQFQKRVESKRGELVRQGMKLLELAVRIVSRRFEVILTLEATKSKVYEKAHKDVRTHLERLIGPNFMLDIPVSELAELLRYMEAMLYRLTHLHGKVSRDSVLMDEVEPWELRLEQLRDNVSNPTDFVRLRFAVEEFRVALFAQPLGTRAKVSKKRLGEMFDEFEGK